MTILLNTLSLKTYMSGSRSTSMRTMHGTGTRRLGKLTTLTGTRTRTAGVATRTRTTLGGTRTRCRGRVARRTGRGFTIGVRRVGTGTRRRVTTTGLRTTRSRRTLLSLTSGQLERLCKRCVKTVDMLSELGSRGLATAAILTDLRRKFVSCGARGSVSVTRRRGSVTSCGFRVKLCRGCRGISGARLRRGTAALCGR